MIHRVTKKNVKKVLKYLKKNGISVILGGYKNSTSTIDMSYNTLTYNNAMFNLTTSLKNTRVPEKPFTFVTIHTNDLEEDIYGKLSNKYFEVKKYKKDLKRFTKIKYKKKFLELLEETGHKDDK